MSPSRSSTPSQSRRPARLRRVAAFATAVAVAVLASASPALSSSPHSATAAAPPPGPALTVSADELAGALTCSPGVESATRDPALLFPAFSTAEESYGGNYLQDLPARGIPTCSITLDDRGFADLQRAAEFAVYAIREVSARSGRQVAVLGHQHGAINWLLALRYWPDLPAKVSDYISLATPHGGTTQARGFCDGKGSCPPSVWQIATDSQLLAAVTSEQAPAGPAYTSMATEFDVLITPAPETSAMRGARNIVLQDLCPGRPVEHFTIIGDDLARRLTFDALDNPGPAEPSRLDDPCGGQVDDGGDGGDGPSVSGLGSLGFAAPFLTNFAVNATPAEPPLRCYVAGTCLTSAPAVERPIEASPSPAGTPDNSGPSEAARLRTLPSTGAPVGLAAGALLLLVAGLAGRYRRAATD